MFLDIQRAVLLLWVASGFAATVLFERLLPRLFLRKPYQVRARQALERLGMTYLKLGQFLAMRFDILPPELCDELRKLFDAVPPMSFETAKRVVEKELNGPLGEFFNEFNVEPLAAASVAQVHEARNKRNERLAVKIQRPRIQQIFEADMHNLRRLAFLVDKSGWFPGVSAGDVAREFTTYTRRELDFRLEGETADRLRTKALSCEIIPTIYWELSTSRLLTMEFIEGLSVSQTAALLEQEGIEAVRARLANFDLEEALHNFAFVSLHQLFGTGFFHADPHPGNIILLDDNQIALVDFGIFGILTDDKRKLLSGYIENVALGNINESYRYYSRLSTPSGNTDIAAFAQDTKTTLRRWYEASLVTDSPVRDRHLGFVIGEITAALRRHQVHIDVDTLLFWRAAIALDSSALSLSSNFDLVREMRFYFERQRPSAIERVMEVTLDRERAVLMRDLIERAPPQYHDLLEELSEGHYSPIYLQESAIQRKRSNRDARALSVALVGFSMMLVAFSWDVRLGISVAVLVFLFQMLSIMRSFQ